MNEKEKKKILEEVLNKYAKEQGFKCWKEIKENSMTAGSYEFITNLAIDLAYEKGKEDERKKIYLECGILTDKGKPYLKITTKRQLENIKKLRKELKELREDIKKIVELPDEIIKINPFPKDIFVGKTEEGKYAQFGNKVWKNCCNEFQKQIKEIIGDK